MLSSNVRLASSPSAIRHNNLVLIFFSVDFSVINTKISVTSRMHAELFRWFVL